MKKIIFILLLTLVGAFAFAYPDKFADFLKQYMNNRQEIVVVTNQPQNDGNLGYHHDNIYKGQIKFVGDDYIIFEGSFGNMVLTLQNIVEVYRD